MRFSNTTASLLMAGSFAMLSSAAQAQQSVKWSDVECAQSHLTGFPASLKCRATNIYAGGTSAGSDGNGTFQHWSAFGTVGKTKLFYFLKEAVDTRASIIAISLQDAVTGFAPNGKSAKDFSTTTTVAGGDYARFTGANDDACVALRKNGASRGRGHKYYILATKCVPKGETIPDSDLAGLLAPVDARS